MHYVGSTITFCGKIKGVAHSESSDAESILEGNEETEPESTDEDEKDKDWIWLSAHLVRFIFSITKAAVQRKIDVCAHTWIRRKEDSQKYEWYEKNGKCTYVNFSL